LLLLRYVVTLLPCDLTTLTGSTTDPSYRWEVVCRCGSACKSAEGVPRRYSRCWGCCHIATLWTFCAAAAAFAVC
jgi:hypothetical protein